MADAALTLPTNPVELNKTWTESSAWFKERCAAMRMLWEIAIKEAQAEDEELHGKEGTRSRTEIAAFIADNSTTDLQKLEAELASMQVRTSIIVAAATLMFAVFVLKGSTDKGVMVAVGTILLALALLLTAVSFVLAIGALAPSIKKAWGSPYDDHVYWDLLVKNTFHIYVMNSWLANRRTPIITTYKRAHSIAVPLLKWASILTIPGLAFVFLG
jgi:hypothetical protein